MLNQELSINEIKSLVPQLKKEIPYLKMLVLFGSRARGNTHAKSDWDFATLYNQERRELLTKNSFALFEVPIVISQILKIPDNKIDVVDLSYCSALIAHYIARDGKLLYEQEPGEFEKFRQKALISDAELKQIRQQQREEIEKFLQRWGV